jgi:hypothetical protein
MGCCAVEGIPCIYVCECACSSITLIGLLTVFVITKREEDPRDLDNEDKE